MARNDKVMYHCNTDSPERPFWMHFPWDMAVVVSTGLHLYVDATVYAK